MHPQTKNIMMRNLRDFLNQGSHGLDGHQLDVLKQVDSFLRTPVDSPIFTEEQVQGKPDMQGNKQGDFFEVLSATGTGKTRTFGMMAKAMDVPALIVTPRNILNKQTRDEFCKEIGIPPEEVAVYDGAQSFLERQRVLEGNPPPKLVITSYQSLTPLLSRHELDISNPQDVHYRPLVILDELHEGQGMQTAATIRKLMRKVLVAGFTATDAGASQTLFEGQKPIYHLPLKEAIDRGILCDGIRTGVIDVAVKESWIDNFLKDLPRSADYRREDVERFSQSPSVIEGAVSFHLGHIDPKRGKIDGYEDGQLGKISRLPTIFYTEGVEAAREGAAAFNKRAAEMGVNAKAAYVSGSMRGSEVKSILDQFKRGEIQAVWNDRLLGMGFDAKNATVCYSLKPSRKAHLVEQQLGRVGRRQDEDYHEKYGQDKVALAINVRGQNMDPVLFGRVLENQPAVYRRDYSPLQMPFEGDGKSRADGLRLSLPDGVDVHLDYNDLQGILSESAKQAAKYNEMAPVKTSAWLNIGDMAERSGRSDSTISVAYKALQSAWEEALGAGLTSFTTDGMTIPIDKAGLFRGGQKTIFCLHEDMVGHFFLPEKTKDWLAMVDMVGETRRSAQALKPIYDSLQEAWREAKRSGAAAFTAQGITLPTDKAGIFISHTQNVFCVHKDTLPLFNPKDKTSEWLNVYDMVKQSRRSLGALSPLYAALKTAWEEAQQAGAKSFTAQGITVPTEKAGIYRESIKPLFCLHEDMLPAFVTPERPPGFLMCAQMAQEAHKTGKTMSALYEALKPAWEKAREAGAETFTAEGITLPTAKAGLFRSGFKTPFCIHEDMIPLLTTPQKAADWVGIVEMSDQTGRDQSVVISPLYKSLEAAWKKARAGGELTFTVDGLTIPTDKAGIFQSGSQSPFCLHKDMVEPLRAHLAQNDKTTVWLSASDMARRAHARTVTISELYKPLRTAWEKARETGEESFTAQGITLPVNAAKTFGRDSFHIHEDQVPLFEIPRKTTEWLGSTEMGVRARRDQKSITSPLYKSLETAWEKAKDAGEETFSAEGLTIPTAKAGRFLGGTQTIFCLHEDLVDMIHHVKLTPKRFTDAVGGEHSILPGSAHLRRTGRQPGLDASGD